MSLRKGMPVSRRKILKSLAALGVTYSVMPLVSKRRESRRRGALPYLVWL